MTPMQKAKARMLVNHVFFATILLSTQLKESTNNDTAWTNGKVIGYNPAFINNLPIDAVIFVLAHEVLHVALLHPLRRGARNPLLWNVACDYAINLMLVNAGLQMPADPQTGKPMGLLDRKYAGMSAEHIYELLKEERDKQRKKKGHGQPGQPSPDGGQDKSTGIPEIDEAIGRMGDDIVAGDVVDPDEAMDIERKVKQTVAQAATMAKMMGKLPGELERLVNEILNPKVPWQQLLAEFATQVTKDEESWMRRNRRFKVYLPDRHELRINKVGIIGDTSGSIGTGELKTMASEAYDIFSIVAPRQVHILWADSRVAGEQVFEQGDTFTPEPKGGGGTDMRVPLRQFEDDPPDVVILFTDGHTPWPDREPDYPLIVCCTTDVKVPIGRVVRV